MEAILLLFVLVAVAALGATAQLLMDHSGDGVAPGAPQPDDLDLGPGWHVT